jgi:hypothetical protein
MSDHLDDAERDFERAETLDLGRSSGVMARGLVSLVRHLRASQPATETGDPKSGTVPAEAMRLFWAAFGEEYEAWNGGDTEAARALGSLATRFAELHDLRPQPVEGVSDEADRWRTVVDAINARMPEGYTVQVGGRLSATLPNVERLVAHFESFRREAAAKDARIAQLEKLLDAALGRLRALGESSFDLDREPPA